MSTNEPTPDMVGRTPNGRPDVAGIVADRRRRAVLGLHINTTIERGLEIISGPRTSKTVWEVVALLAKAEPKYTRLGGEAPYWKDGVSKGGHRGGPPPRYAAGDLRRYVTPDLRWTGETR